MNGWPEREVFVANLGAWAIRGVLCALPSFVLAVMMPSRRPLEIAEMVAGVATYVLGFAWVTALPEFRQRVHGSDLGWALRVAANTRAALAPLMFLGPDLVLGALSIAAVRESARLVAGIRLPEHVFGLTYVITLVQGALVSATMFLLALVIWGGRELFGKGGLKPRPTAQGTS